MFSSFLEFKADRFDRWVTDPQLRRSMERELQGTVEAPESQWAVQWHQRWRQQSNSLGRAHLIAYLQEPCYWVSYRAARFINNSQYRSGDCFQLLLVNIDRILKGFRADRGSSLKSYANMAMPTLLRDILRQRQDAYLCGNWALLRRVSKRQLKRAVQEAGLRDAALTEHCLAWSCYKACHGGPGEGTGRNGGAPSSEQLARVAQLYNQERLSQLGPGSQAITATVVEQWLGQTSSWLRSSLQPPVTSLNRPLAVGEEGRKRELQDSLASSQHASLTEAAIEQEAEEQLVQQQVKLSRLLEVAIAKLPSETQQLLTAYYQTKLTQSEIAQKLEIKQYTVSRRLTRTRESLLKTVGDWSQATLHISLTPNQVVVLSALLEDWLIQHYSLDGQFRSHDCDVHSAREETV